MLYKIYKMYMDIIIFSCTFSLFTGYRIYVSLYTGYKLYMYPCLSFLDCIIWHDVLLHSSSQFKLEVYAMNPSMYSHSFMYSKYQFIYSLSFIYVLKISLHVPSFIYLCTQNILSCMYSQTFIYVLKNSVYVHFLKIY